ncbi:MAG: Suppressor of the cold-sensitive snRNP biogenesis mutant brr1-1, partial [Bathelium mastoideum]
MRLLPFFVLLLTSVNAIKFPRRSIGGTLAPYHRPDARLVPSTYIVRLSEDHSLAKHFAHCGVDLSKTSPRFEQISGLYRQGTLLSSPSNELADVRFSYRAQLDDYTVNQLVRTDPGVEYVEHDHYIRAPQTTSHAMHGNLDFSTSSNNKRWDESWVRKPYWHLQMITAGKKARIGNGTVDPVRILKTAGRGVNAYVLDWGVRITHRAFHGRASNFQNRTTTPYCEGGSFSMRDTSNDSHGTAVAGLLGAGGGFSISFTNIINVKIFCQSEAATWMVAKAITDVTNEHRTFVRTRPAWFKGSVINLSFSTDYSPTTARAIEEASRAGIAIVTAAGNT